MGGLADQASLNEDQFTLSPNNRAPTSAKPIMFASGIFAASVVRGARKHWLLPDQQGRNELKTIQKFQHNKKYLFDAHRGAMGPALVRIRNETKKILLNCDHPLEHIVDLCVHR